MEQRSKLSILLIAGCTGILSAYGISTTLYRNELQSTLEWGITISLLALGFGAVSAMLLPGAWKNYSAASKPARLWGMVLAITAGIFFGINTRMVFLIPFIFIGLILTAPTLSSLQQILEEKRILRSIIAWMFGGLGSFFALGFFKNFHPSFLEFLFITPVLNLFLFLMIESVIEQVIKSLRGKPLEKLIPSASLMLGFLLILLTLRLLVQYPTIFSPGFFLPVPDLVPAFIGMTILSQGWAMLLLLKLDALNWKTSPLIIWINRNLPGLLLASAISVSAYLLATALVSYNLDFMDIYFQSDSPFWLNFLTIEADQIIVMRAVHPFVLLLLRPPVWLISLILQGDKYHAAILLNSAFGGVCVFLAWLFFKQRTGKTTYALLIAALLGISTSHLFLSAFLESYIFSAAALITFVILSQSKGSRFPQIVSAGLVTFGITITNFIQTCVILLLTRWNIKTIFKYVMVVLAIAVVLAFAQNIFYPTSAPFYITKNLKGEDVFRYDYLDLGPDLAYSVFTSRVNVIARGITLFSIVAPRPLIHTDEVKCLIPCLRTMRYFRGAFRYASYIGFGSFLARTWFLGLILAGVIFAWRFFKSPRQAALQTALLINIIFNFVLHVNYGEDPLLYSPDWTYALVFFFGISFENLADKKWFQIILIIFIAAITFNNIEFFGKLLETILPYR
ncbi:MAG: hypothetical protein C3F07_10980 [Anaerolineales bacterium]|nr:MAG: hypothetical protein C3F07_10980 [Anaerolineales bacterium]